MSKITRKGDLWNQTVPTVTDSAIETVDGKDPGTYKRYDANGTRVSRELTVEIGAGMAALSIQLLARIARLMKLPAAHTAPNKSIIIEAFQDLVIRSGVKLLVSRMTRATMKRISLVFGLGNTKQRNIVDHILRVGLPVFLHEKCDVPLFVDFCGILGLESGKCSEPSSDHNSSTQQDPQPPYITYNRTHGLVLTTNPVDGSFTAEPAVQDDDETSTGTRLLSHASFLAKSSAELERELADEIMLMGMEDLLRALTVPTLHEIAVEMNLIPPPGVDPATMTGSTSSLQNSSSSNLARDITREFAVNPPREPHFYISIIMDHVFDLVPLQEYVKHIPATLPTPGPSFSSTSETGTSTNQIPPSSPFMSSVENAKKRKANDPSVLAQPLDLDTPTKPSTTSSTGNGAANGSSHASKKAKISETESISTSQPDISPDAATHDESASSMQLDSGSGSDAKRGRGRQPKASTAAPASTAPTSASPSSSSSMQVSTSSATDSTAAQGTPNGRDKNAKRSSAAPVTPSTAPAVKVPEDVDSSNHEEESSEESEESAEEASEDKSSSISTPLNSRASRRAKTQAMHGSPSSGLYSQRTPKSSGAKGQPSSSGKGGPKSPEHMEEEEEYTDDDDSSSEEEVRTTPTGGKGRAKYQAPPLSQIKKGISGQELHNLYNVTDLQEWCRLHKADHTGKKSAVIKRILYTLDPANTKPPPPKRSRRFSTR